MDKTDWKRRANLPRANDHRAQVL